MNKGKLEIIDEILMGYEDWMHGTDGDMCTRARGLLDEVKKDLAAQSLKGEGDCTFCNGTGERVTGYHDVKEFYKE